MIYRAKEGIYPLNLMKRYTENYLKAGGEDVFSSYYTAKYDNAVMLDRIKKNIVFARHNLVTDAVFNEFNVILCRNVMIYFNRELQNRVHGLIYESLTIFGFLGLGEFESLLFTIHKNDYEEVSEVAKIYKKIKTCFYNK